MDQRAGVQIQRRAFFQSFAILLALMILAGVLTRVVPAGSYACRLAKSNRSTLILLNG